MELQPAAKFFQEFEKHILEAGCYMSDIHVAGRLQHNTNYNIDNRIYTTRNKPVDYNDWKKHISNMDTLWHRGQIFLGKQDTSSYATTQLVGT